jgi:hypothetical protein
MADAPASREREEYEASRWHSLVSIFLDRVPEIRPEPDDEDVISPAGSGARLLVGFLRRTAPPGSSQPTCGPGSCVCSRSCSAPNSSSKHSGGGEEDRTLLGTFAEAGIVCEITRSQSALEALLPLMGPLAVQAAHREVAAHASSRGFAEGDVDWAIRLDRRTAYDTSVIGPAMSETPVDGSGTLRRPGVTAEGGALWSGRPEQPRSPVRTPVLPSHR